MYLKILKILTVRTGIWFPVTFPSSFLSGCFSLITDSFCKADTKQKLNVACSATKLIKVGHFVKNFNFFPRGRT
jgi:hypothetical protein